MKSTPLHKCKNLGPTTEAELNSIGIRSMEQMKEIGWKKVCFEYIYHFPARTNLNMITAVIGAIHNQDWRTIDPKLKEEAKEFLEFIKEGNKI